MDGEYIYSPAATYAAKCSTGSSGSDSEADVNTSDRVSGSVDKASKRFSKIGLDMMDWRQGGEEKRLNTVSVRGVKWDRGVHV